MTAIAAFAAAGLALSLVSSRAPYRRAGLQFWPAPGQNYGVVVVAIAELRDGAVEQLLEDPNIDVSIGKTDTAFRPIASMDELETLFDEIGSMLLLEQDRQQNTSTAAGAGAQAPAPEASDTEGNLQGGSGEAAAGSSATDAPEVARTPGQGESPGEQQPAADQAAPPVVAPAPDAEEVKRLAAAAKTPAGATVKVGGKPKAAAKPKPVTK